MSRPQVRKIGIGGEVRHGVCIGGFVQDDMQCGLLEHVKIQKEEAMGNYRIIVTQRGLCEHMTCNMSLVSLVLLLLLSSLVLTANIMLVSLLS